MYKINKCYQRFCQDCHHDYYHSEYRRDLITKIINLRTCMCLCVCHHDYHAPPQLYKETKVRQKEHVGEGKKGNESDTRVDSTLTKSATADAETSTQEVA